MNKILKMEHFCLETLQIVYDLSIRGLKSEEKSEEKLEASSSS